MNRRTLCLILLVSSFVTLHGADTLSVIEPLSRTEFRLPSATADTVGTAFFKGGYSLLNSYLMLYSMRNNKEEKFPWSELNMFEKERKLGHRISEKRLPDIDAWQRVFKSNNRGVPVFHCLTIVNGNGYAIYVLENSLDSTFFSSPSIIANTEFRDMQGVRIARQVLPEWANVLIYVAMLAIMALLTYLINEKKWQRWPLVCLDILATVGMFIYLYVLEKLTFPISLVFAGLFAIAATIMICSTNNKDLKENIEKVFKMFCKD